MTRTELIDALATRTSIDRKEAKVILDVLATIVEEEMRRGGEVPFKGLGKFKVQHRKAREGRNPITGEPVQIPAKTIVKFTMAKSLKTILQLAD